MARSSFAAPASLGGPLVPALDAGGLRYCVLHGWQHLPGALPAEVDLAIAPEDVRRLEDHLRRYPGGRIVQLLEYEAGSYCFVLAAEDGADIRFLAIDVAPDYRQDGAVIFAAGELLRDRTRRDGLWVAGEAAEFAYLLAKKVSKRHVPVHQRARLQFLCASLGARAAEVASRLLGPRWGPRAAAWMTAAEWDQVEGHLQRLRRALLWASLRRQPLAPLRYWLADLRRRWQRWRLPSGICVAVAGADEHTRTSLLEALQRELAGAFRHCAVQPPAAGAIDHALRLRPLLARSTLVLHDWSTPPRAADGRAPHRAGAARPPAVLRPDLLFVLAPAGRPRDAGPGAGQSPAPPDGAIVLDGGSDASGIARTARDAALDYLHRRYMQRRAVWFPHTEAETLAWLTEALCLSPRLGRFEFEAWGARGAEAAPAFGWLSLESGRGYLIPMGSAVTAARALDLYNARRPRARLAAAGMRLALRAGAGGWLLHQVRLTGVDGSAPRGVLLEYLREVLGCADLAVAISLGTSSPHRKPVLLALAPDGTPLAYVKVGAKGGTNAFVQHEVRTLRSLAHAAPRSFAVPQLLHAGWWNGRYVCVQSPLPSGRVRGVPERPTLEYATITAEMAALGVRRARLEDSLFWRRLLRLTASAAHTWYREPLERGLAVARRALAADILPFHFSHGDFAPWNMKRVDGTVVVFDWEHARRDGLPGADLIHLMFETLRARRSKPREMATRFREDPEFRAGLDQHFRRLGLSPGQRDGVLFLYLLGRLASRVVAASGHVVPFAELHALVQLLQMLEPAG